MFKLLWKGQLKQGKTAATKIANRNTAAYASNVDFIAHHVSRFHDGSISAAARRRDDQCVSNLSVFDGDRSSVTNDVRGRCTYWQPRRQRWRLEPEVELVDGTARQHGVHQTALLIRWRSVNSDVPHDSEWLSGVRATFTVSSTGTDLTCSSDGTVIITLGLGPETKLGSDNWLYCNVSINSEQFSVQSHWPWPQWHSHRDAHTQTSTWSTTASWLPRVSKYIKY